VEGGSGDVGAEGRGGRGQGERCDWRRECEREREKRESAEQRFNTLQLRVREREVERDSEVQALCEQLQLERQRTKAHELATVADLKAMLLDTEQLLRDANWEVHRLQQRERDLEREVLRLQV
jgi:hypothetical protein